MSTRARGGHEAGLLSLRVALLEQSAAAMAPSAMRFEGAALTALLCVENAAIDPCSADAEGRVRNNALYRCDRTMTLKFLRRYVQMLSGELVSELVSEC